MSQRLNTVTCLLLFHSWTSKSRISICYALRCNRFDRSKTPSTLDLVFNCRVDQSRLKLGTKFLINLNLAPSTCWVVQLPDTIFFTAACKTLDQFSARAVPQSLLHLVDPYHIPPVGPLFKSVYNIRAASDSRITLCDYILPVLILSVLSNPS